MADGGGAHENVSLMEVRMSDESFIYAVSYYSTSCMLNNIILRLIIILNIKLCFFFNLFIHISLLLLFYKKWPP